LGAACRREVVKSSKKEDIEFRSDMVVNTFLECFPSVCDPKDTVKTDGNKSAGGEGNDVFI